MSVTAWHWQRRLAAAIVSAALLGAPACTHAPDRAEGYGTRSPRAKPSIEDVPVRGYRARIKLDDGDRLVGELLVAEPDGVVVVRTRKHGDQTRATSAVKRATIITDPKLGAWLGGIGGGTAVLITITVATGWYSFVLMPIVVVGGSIAFGVAYAESRVILRDDKLRYLHQYARWPQGRPSDSARPSSNEWAAPPLTSE
jgi:hypothetical protein